MNTDWKLAKPGIYKGITRAQYESIPAVNQSTLKLLKPTAMHGKYAIEHPRKSSEQMSIGTATHTCLLEPSKIKSSFIEMPDVDGRTKEGKDAKAQFEEMAQGRTVFQKKDMDLVRGCVEAAKKHPGFMQLLAGAKAKEVVVVWNDALTSIACKALIDIVGEAGGAWVVCDVKTSRNADRPQFQKDILKYGYHIQAAFYVDGVMAHTRCNAPFIIAVVENEPPHAVAIYEMGMDSIEIGRKEYRRLMALYDECCKSGVWPGYPNELSIIDIPHWAIQQEQFFEE